MAEPSTFIYDLIVVAPAWSDDLEALFAANGTLRILAIMPERLAPLTLPAGGSVTFHFLRASHTPTAEIRALKQFSADRCVLVLPAWRDLEFARYVIAMRTIRCREALRWYDGRSERLRFNTTVPCLYVRKLWLQRYRAGWLAFRVLLALLLPLLMMTRLIYSFRHHRLARQLLGDSLALVSNVWRHHFINPQAWGALCQRPALIAGYIGSYLTRPIGHAAPNNPQRILVIAPDLLGDTLTIVPLVRALAQRWPKAQIEAIVAPKSAELLRGCPYISRYHPLREYHPFNHHSKPFLGCERAVADMIVALRAEPVFDLVINASFWPERARLINALPSGYRISVPSSAILAWDTHFVAAHPSGHIFRMVLSIAEALGAPPVAAPDATESEAEARLWIDDAERLAAGERLRPLLGPMQAGERLIGISTFAALSSRRYPLETFAAFMRHAAAETPTRFIIFDKLNLLYATADLPPNCIYIGDWGLRDAIAAMTSLSAFVANEGGLSHMAYTQQVPCVLVYTSINPHYWRPGERAMCLYEQVACSPCSQAFCHRDLACHRGITAAQLVQALPRAQALQSTR